MEGDTLADILTLAGARCVRVGCLKAGGSWALRFPPPQKIKLTAVVKGVTANRPGSVLASKQLAQLLFIQIIRFYLAASEPLTTGWLRALNDARIAPALRLMHGEPGRPWRLGELAKQVGMSRTSFALRFKANAGVGPLTYLQNF